MGANSSTSGASSTNRDLILRREGSQFLTEEKEAINNLFDSIAGGPAQVKTVFEESDLQAYFEKSDVCLSRPAVTGFFNALLGDDRDNYKQYSHNDNPQLSFYYFVKHLAYILRGSVVERAQCLYLFCSKDSSALTRSTLGSSIVELIKISFESDFAKVCYPHLIDFSCSSDSADRLATLLMGSLPDTDTIPQETFENWLSNDMANKIFVQSFSYIVFQGVPHTSILITTPQSTSKMLPHTLPTPMKTIHPLLKETFNSQLLDHSSLMLLTTYLPVEYRGRIYPLFSSYCHGESFSMFCKQLVSSVGPTIIVVKDTDDHVFGAFAAENWQFGPKFRGNANCFLFSLSPTMGVYVPSGYNENYMYLEQHTQTLPNGLGMGGQMDYFGLWLSADYGSGHSKAKPKCSTYNSPRLSKQEEFKVQHLEVWGVGEPVVPDEVDAGPSILDKDKTASALLEMVGRKMYSKDIREQPEEN